MLDDKPSHNCMVCDCLTNNCPPSPFYPYSGWRCKKCVSNHLIPYEDLLHLLVGSIKGESISYEDSIEQFREWWKGSDGNGPDTGREYAEKYILPTLKFFGKTKEEAWKDSNSKLKGSQQC